MSEWTEIKPAISKSLISILKKNKFHKPTPIQSLVLPHFLMNKDVAVQAFTGSGKTLAFVLPIVEKLTQRKEQWKKCETGAVVLLPTRELAVQVAEVFKLFLPSFLTLQPLIGGRREVSADVTAINTEG
jgi:ATP-dependent RNA helicase DDX55/SPB4